VYPEQTDPLTEFYDAIKSPLTKEKYERRLDLFLRHIKVEGSTFSERASGFARRAKVDNQWATYVINEYMRLQKERAERKEIAEATVPNYFKPIKLFCEMNDITLNWKKIGRRIPHGRSYGQDRIPTVEEIKQILSYPDRRIKPAVLVMLSSGIRLGAFDYLNWGHIEKIEEKGQLVAGIIKVYAGTSDEYFSFITPECYEALDEYIAFRKSSREKVGNDSPLIRDLFKPDKLAKGEPHIPRRLKSLGIKRMMEDALKGTGIRKALPEGKRRHEFQVDHGFRKFFKSACEKQMKSLHVEMLMGHSVGLADNYYRPTSQEIMQDYLRAVPGLTILEQVKGPSLLKLEELEKENLALRKEVDEIKAQVKLLSDSFGKKKW
jgi:integrase